jgi:hypothetical protein
LSQKQEIVNKTKCWLDFSFILPRVKFSILSLSFVFLHSEPLISWYCRHLITHIKKTPFGDLFAFPNPLKSPALLPKIELPLTMHPGTAGRALSYGKDSKLRFSSNRSNPHAGIQVLQHE